MEVHSIRLFLRDGYLETKVHISWQQYLIVKEKLFFEARFFNLFSRNR